MEALPMSDQGDKAPRWAIVAILLFFLILGLPRQFYAVFPMWMRFGLGPVLALLACIVPLVVGLFTRLPRWSLVYTGAVLGVIGLYVIFTSLAFLIGPLLGLVRDQLEALTGLTGRLFYEWIMHGLIWLGIGLANLIFLGLVGFVPGLREQRSRFWLDFSLVSFSLYGGILIVYAVDFDEYTREELYVLASMVALALGAWGYLRAKTPGRRTLALLAALTVCLAFMGVGKYFLVPLQDWGPWLGSHPPETERWFESLRTIATWFWTAFFVGLPGLAQIVRKTPASAAAPPSLPASVVHP